MKYVCELCGTVYSEEAGDPAHGIPAGTAFDTLSEYYECPGCGSGKEALNPASPQITRPSAQKNPAFWQETKYSDICPESDR